jgi:hypothetical protein
VPYALASNRKATDEADAAMKRVRPGLAAAIALALALPYMALQALAADNGAQTKIQAQTSVTEKQLSAPPAQAVITSDAVKILHHIAQARGLLNGDSTDIAGAIEELKTADKLLDAISDALPTTKVKDQIWIAAKHLEYEQPDQVLSDLPPVYVSLSDVADYLPTEKARQHLDRAREALRKGVKEEAMAQLKAANEALVYVEAELPMKTAQRLVHKAWQALQRDEPNQADDALDAAEDNVTFISMAFQSPLVQAKSDIARCRNDYKFGNRAAAAGDLSAAVGDLRKAAENADRVTRKAAVVMIGKLNGLVSKLRDADKDFTPQISSAWHRVEALSERAAERVSTAWDREGSNSEVKQDLIEAKLQLAYARIDHVLMRDDDATKVDLSESDDYLNSARTRANIDLEQKLQKMSLQLASLETSLGDARQADNSAAYYALESEMTHLIATL